MGNNQSEEEDVEEQQAQQQQENNNWKKVAEAIWKERIFVMMLIITFILVTQYKFWKDIYKGNNI
jgi:Na+/melibiose symporter-like transporter